MSSGFDAGLIAREPLPRRRAQDWLAPAATWTRVATERLVAGSPGNFGYSLFSISRKDLVRLRELHLDYVRAMQSVIAESRPGECVGLYCAQLLDLAAHDNALSQPEGSRAK